MNVLLIEDRLEDAILIEKQLGREADAAGIEVSVRRADTLGAGIEMASQDGINRGATLLTARRTSFAFFGA